MRGFLIVWLGQLVSLLGTSMTQFGLTIWAFEQTGRATELALIGVFFTMPLLLVSPLAGVIVDRYNRKAVMMSSDLASGVATIGVFALLLTGKLEIWHLYVSAVIQGTFQSVQWPAYSAAIALMLPKSQYTRANSLMDLAGPSSQIFAPLMAGALLGIIGLRGILLIDIVTFLFAITTLVVVYVPQPGNQTDAESDRGRLMEEVLFGFRYILSRRSLLLLQSVFLAGNFLSTLAYTLLAPMILLRTGNNELLLGSVQTIGAVGGVIGGIGMSAWGGFKRRVYGVLLGWGVATSTMIIVGLGRGEPAWTGLPVWGVGIFLGSLASPLINSSNQAIWQSKVSPEFQGRVFSIRAMIAAGITPLAGLIAGPLADRVMEPAMQSGGRLAGAFGWLVSAGPGSGIALIFIVCGLLGVAVACIAFFTPEVRHVEAILSDHDVMRHAVDQRPILPS